MADPFNGCKAHTGIEARLDNVCHKLESLEKLFNVRFNAIETAVDLAKTEMDRRLEGMNEFRAQLSTQASTFISKREVELIMDKIDVRLKLIEGLSFERKGSKQWSDHIITALIAVSVMLIFHYVWKF